MTRPVTIYLLLCLFISGFAIKAEAKKKQPPHYPKMETVADAIISEYRIPETEYHRYRLAKKREGWYLLYLSEDYESVEKEWLYFDVNTRQYKRLPFDKGSNTPHMKRETEKMLTFNSKWANFLPYYGYPGWHEDVIEDFGEEKRLNDTLLDGLGRAYSAYADGLLHAQSDGFSHGSGGLKPFAPWENVTEERAKMFLETEKKALEVFRQLKDKYPEYQSFVGSAANKYSTEMMYAYSTLAYEGFYDLAKQALEAGTEYSPELLELSRTTLANLPQEALLFTTGDNDTYPFWYLQETENLRRDVRVINTSLLALPAYHKAVITGYGYQQGLNSEMIKDGRPLAEYDQYYLVGNGEKKLDEVIQEVIRETELANNPGRLSVNTFVFKGLQEAHPYLKPYGLYKGEYEMQCNSYVLTGTLALMDIIASNSQLKPYLTIGTQYMVGIKNVEDYLLQEGNVYLLTPHDISAPEYKVDLFQSYEQLMKLKWNPDGKPATEKKATELARMANSLRTQFAEAAKAYHRNGEKEKAAQLLERINTLLPANVYFQEGAGLIQVASAMQETADKESARKLLEQILAEFDRRIAGCKENCGELKDRRELVKSLLE